jgi:hypothetical protein
MDIFSTVTYHGLTFPFSAIPSYDEYALYSNYPYNCLRFIFNYLFSRQLLTSYLTSYKQNESKRQSRITRKARRNGSRRVYSKVRVRPLFLTYRHRGHCTVKAFPLKIESIRKRPGEFQYVSQWSKAPQNKVSGQRDPQIAKEFLWPCPSSRISAKSTLFAPNSGLLNF